MAQKKLEEENLGYQRRIKIKLPADVKIGFDPFEDPAQLLPIDDSFRQIPYPVDKNGHIMLSGGDPNFVDGIPTVPAGKPEDVNNKDYQPLPVDVPPPMPTSKVTKIEAVTNAPEQPEVPEMNGPTAMNKSDVPTMSMDESGQEEYEEKVVQKDVGEDGITEQDYYHGLLPREDVDKLLSKPGDFLLRVTEINAGDTRTSCITARPIAGGQIQTFMLKKDKGKLFLTEPVGFDSIVDLVNNYMKTKKIFGRPSCQLLRPICRQEWEFYQDQVKCVKPIGNGAYGQVFFGKLTLKSSAKPMEVAVKQMKLSMMNRDKIEDIMREARLMRMMIHDNIVRCLGVCADQEPLMIVIEYVAGGALDAYLRMNGPKISVYERVSMCLDAARGLSHVHKMGIIHRDVAARNCLYTRNCLKISDFGLSRQATIYKADPAERCPIKYLAPEVFISHTYTSQADVWAYGVLMYEIFSNGAEPYARKTPPQVKQIVVNQGSLLGPPSWAPDYIKSIMSECFVKHPRARTKFSTIVNTFITVRAAEQKHADVILAMKMAKKKGKLKNKPTGPKAKPGPSTSQRKVKKKKEKEMTRTHETREEVDVSSKKSKNLKEKRPSKCKKGRKSKKKHR